jgi:hypothetical protein
MRTFNTGFWTKEGRLDIVREVMETAKSYQEAAIRITNAGIKVTSASLQGTVNYYKVPHPFIWKRGGNKNK